MNFKNTLKTLLLIASCGLFMGNKGCDSEEAIMRGRILKKSASSLGITSRPVQVNEEGDSIDIEGIINGQYLNELQNSQYFVSTDRNQDVQSLSDEAGLLARRNGQSFRPLSFNPSGECTKNLPEVVLQGSATEFELGNEFGFNIGFGPAGLFGLFQGVEFNLSRMTMGLNLDAFQPKTGIALGSSFQRGVKRNRGAGISFNIGGLILNPSIVLRQPAAEVISETLGGALTDLGARLEEPWSARVFQENDSHILINAGFRHGLQKGDTLYISNVGYTWSGEACNSELLFQRNLQDRDNPIAKVIIETEPSADMTIARVFDSRGVDIQEGARAYIYFLRGSQDENDPLPDAPNPEDVFN